MNLEPQGFNECLLATYSAVSGMPLKEVREEALKITETETWSEAVFGLPEKAKEAIKSLCEKRNLSPELFLTHYQFKSWEEVDLCLNRSSPDLSGFGTILVILVPASCGFSIVAHIMPFKNGYLYDLSSAPIKPETYEEFYDRAQSHLRKVGVIKVVKL